MKLITVTALLYLGISTLCAQDSDTKKQPFPISISVMHESTSLPFVSSPIKYQYNPALLIGTEFLLKKKNAYDFHLSGNLGYYYHKNWESTLFIEGRLGYRYIMKRFSISPNIGLGYAHVFTPQTIYGFDDGMFQAINDNGRSAFQTSLSLVPSYKLYQNENSAEIYGIYTFTLQYPFSETNGFHQFIGVGFKFYPFKNSSL